jgi:hypothetical protein
MEEFAKKLGIDYPGEVINNKYIIPLTDSDEYSKVYTLLDKSDLVELDTTCTLVTDKVSELQYFNDEFTVKLDANFPEDFYRVVITKEII